jgi:hypothetical protein
MFQVETDQLKVSDGWVRCGHCDGVFDASAHFQIAPVPMAPEIPEGPELPVSPDAQFQAAPLQAGAADPVPAVPAILAAPEPLPVNMTPPSVAASYLPGVAPGAPANDVPPADAALSSYLSIPQVLDEAEEQPPATAPTDSDARLALYGREPKGPSKADVKARRKSEVSFVKTARRRARRSQPLYRALAVILSLTLLAALLIQGLVYERVALAARYPALLPMLQSLCQPLNCQINPPRVIEAIEIDSSSFTQTGPETYRLNFVVKNNRPGAVAMPALEVTLTGAGDKVLVSKIVLPAEYGASSAWLNSALPFAGAFDLQAAPVLAAGVVTAPGDAAAADAPTATEPAPALMITGYRLLAFYP